MKKSFLIALLTALVLGLLLGHYQAKAKLITLNTRVVRQGTPPTSTNSKAASMTPWQALNLGNYQDMIAQLTAAGCPMETIRDLVFMHVTRNYYSRLIAAEAQWHNRQDWWRPQENKREKTQFQRHLKDEMNQQLFQALGAISQELIGNYFGTFPKSESDPWIAPDKQLALRALISRFQDEKENLFDDSRSAILLTEKERQQMNDLETQQHAELAGLLTPKELEDYDLRNSKTARYVLANLPPAQNEEEFRAMVKIAETLHVDELKRNTEWGEDMTLAMKAETAMKDQVKAEIMAKLQETLGQDAVEDLQQAEADAKAREAAENEARNQAQFKDELATMAESVGSDRAAAGQFFDRLQQLQKQWQTTYPDPRTLTAEQQEQVKTQVIAEAEKAAVEIMGDKGHDLIKKLMEKDQKK